MFLSLKKGGNCQTLYELGTFLIWSSVLFKKHVLSCRSRVMMIGFTIHSFLFVNLPRPLMADLPASFGGSEKLVQPGST